MDPPETRRIHEDRCLTETCLEPPPTSVRLPAEARYHLRMNRARMQHAIGWLAAALSLAPIELPSLSAPAEQVHWTIIGQTAVTFDWRGGADRIFFGVTPGVPTRSVKASNASPTPDGPGPFREARLIGLIENQIYYYRIGDGPEHTFRTPPPRGSAGFWFAEQGDIGSTLDYPQVRATQDSIASNEVYVPDDDRPAFVLMVGDLTYGDQDGADRVPRHFTDVMSWSQDRAYMPCWGNHEWDGAGSTKADQIHNYKGRFELPNSQQSPGTGTACIAKDSPGEDWGWFDYGNVRFISYPPANDNGCGYSMAYSDWRARADLVMAQADADPKIRFIVTYGHFPPYSSGSDHGGDSELALAMTTLKAAHSKYVLNFAGHSHHYERFHPAQTGGVLQILGPGGGSQLGGLGPALPSTAFRMNHLEHLKVRVSANRIEGFAVCGPSRPEETATCTPGTIIDTWTIVSPTTAVDAIPATPQRRGYYDVQGRRVEKPDRSGIYYDAKGRRVVLRK